MKIVLEPYSKDWAESYNQISTNLYMKINKEVEIYHIGSTSIPNICAKPIIDVLIGIAEDHILDDYVEPITVLGYKYIPEYETDMPYRRFFVMYDQNERPTQHIHLVHLSHVFFENHVFFRNYMIQNPDKAKQYENLKIHLSKKEWEDRNEYASAKSEFISGIMKNKI